VPRPRAECAGRASRLGACVAQRVLVTQSQPGRRFEERYWRKRHAAHRGLKRLAWIASAVLFLVLGLVFSVLPGPGIVFLLAGFGMLAQESLAVARALDRAELALRRLFRRVHPR
jgi:hypothetical protein